MDRDFKRIPNESRHDFFSKEKLLAPMKENGRDKTEPSKEVPLVKGLPMAHGNGKQDWEP